MDYRSEWTDGAVSELWSIVVRIARDDPAAARRVESAIKRKVAFLRSFPPLAELHSRTPEGEVRESQVGNYRIFHLVVPDDRLVRVIHIQHAKMSEPDFGE
jgi:plasmid stabilization system protein ParE